jgi:hypothetical protein
MTTLSTPLQTAELHNWAYVTIPPDPYKAPELQVGRLSGEVYGHPQFPDGATITTSRLLHTWRDEHGEAYGQTRNTRYHLVEIHPEYLQWITQNDFDLNKLFTTPPTTEESV